MLMTLALTAALIAAPAEPDAASLLSGLDLTSFANSTGPRHLPAPARPAEAGFTVESGTGDWAWRSAADGGWTIGLKVLADRGDRIDVCFSDVAHNGGSYFVQTALTLRREGQGYAASRAGPDAACPELRDRAGRTE